MSVQPHYVWEVPGRPLAIQISLPLIDRMNAEIMKAFAADPQRGVEIGGLLLGRIAEDSVFVEDFEALPSEHRRGQSYDLSPSDRVRLARRLAKSSKDGLSTVGFFRSHTRPGLYLDEDDYSVIEQHFPAPQVVLLVRPAAAGSATAGFFFWEDGEMVRRQSYRTFPFSSGELSSGKHTIAGTAPAPGLAIQKIAAPPAVFSPLPPPPARRAVSRPALIAALLAISALGVLAYRAGFSRPDLALKVARVGDLLRVNWNRTSPLVRHADRGVLWIRDGGQQKRIDLNARDLTQGSVEFRPSSPDVDFRLEVNSGNKTATEGVRTVIKSGAEEPAKPTPAAVAKAYPPSAPVIVQTPLVEHVPMAFKPAPPPTVAKVSPPPAAQTAPSAAPAFEPPPLEIETPRPVPTRIASIERPLPHLPSATSSVSVEPADVSVFRKTVAHLPLLAQLQHRRYNAGKDFVAAHPLRRVSPALPPRIARELTGEQLVDLKVSIDKNGKVKRTELVSKESDQELAELASTAVRNAEFEPARIGDRPVPSELFMHFRFAPK